MSGRCHHCEQTCEKYENYCSWDCMVNEAKTNGGKIHCPNGLPIHSIKADGSMWEHEHGDHPDYIMPVTAIYTDKEEAKEYDGDTFLYEDSERALALIYVNTCIAVTMYEYDYVYWHLATRKLDAEHYLFKPGEKGEWMLSEESLVKIIAYLNGLERFKDEHWMPQAWRTK